MNQIMQRINFTVDSALLQELGERLVGKPYIALAELVKNSYDADANEVEITLALEEDRIEVLDDGHGMTFEEFRKFWMRVGTPHKSEKRVSKYLKRTMTGSKGVGRLAVQFLARKLEVITVARESEGQWLEAKVDWAEAVEAGDLTQASVEFALKDSLPPFERGTCIVLKELKHEWDREGIEGLARELWWLQPPFRSSSASRLDPQDAFEIDFQSNLPEFEQVFEKQMRAILGIWTARLVGRNEKGRVSLSLEFAGESPQVYTYDIADFPHNQVDDFNEKENLNDGEFELRIYGLKYRQPEGIKVGEAREYFWKHGGVHVYDGGFRLPYYGDPKNDWLEIEFDHAHRKFASELLPSEFQVGYLDTQRLRYLPTLGRVFGVVNVNTSEEPNLDILITRDRLAESSTAFQDLVAMVRYAFDLYAFEEARRRYQYALREAPTEPTSIKFERVERVLDYYEPEIPEPVYKSLSRSVQEAAKAASTSQKVIFNQMSLMAPLATAGISALAYQHELRKQFSAIENIIERIGCTRTDDPALQRSLDSLRQDLSSWLERARATNALFDYLADAENTKERHRFPAVVVIEDVRRQMSFLARGVKVDTSGVDRDLFLPEASLAEWSAIFQNVFTNAFNAMLDSEERLLLVSSRAEDEFREILVQDTGRGVDLRDKERLFEPFERGLEASPERRALGYGGTGLGLTIVRLLAERIGCSVDFVEPDEKFSTAFSISWRETR